MEVRANVSRRLVKENIELKKKTGDYEDSFFYV
jgi:hypothetical protein